MNPLMTLEVLSEKDAQLMRAFRVSAFADRQAQGVESTSIPEPGPGQVRVRLAAAGVNPVDSYIAAGTYEFFTPALPYTPGFDGAGVLDAIGEDMRGDLSLKRGERVVVTTLGSADAPGTFAEYVVCDADCVRPLPEHLDFVEGAALGIPYWTAWLALRERAAVQAGEWVFVHGASGGVGIAAIQLAVAGGARVVGSASTISGASRVLAAGAQRCLDHGRAGYLDELADMTGGQGPNVIVEMMANVNLEADLKVVAKRGRIVVVGSRGEATISPRLAMIKDATIMGIALWNCTPAERRAALDGVAATVAQHRLRPDVGVTLTLADTSSALAEVTAAGKPGRVVLTTVASDWHDENEGIDP